ncbi:G1/S-specific cyclin-E1 [Coemansia sp. RSA 1722]|nr:G1/S-specific cyclin-E1 [Coemansia sp. RSA 1722]
MLFKKSNTAISSGLYPAASPRTSAHTADQHETAMAKGHTGRAGYLFNKTRCAIKRKVLKVASKTTANLKVALGIKKEAYGYQATRDFYCSEGSEVTAVQAPLLPAELVIVEPFDSTSILDCFDQLVEKAESILPSLACEPELVSASNDLLAYFESALDNRSKELRYSEETNYCAALNSGMCCHFEDPQKQREIIVNWLSIQASANGYDRKTLHLTMVYLDLFLGEFDELIEPDHMRYYGFACLFLANMAYKPNLYAAEPFEHRFKTRLFNEATNHILQTLDWCLELVDEGDNSYVRQIVEMPTVIDFIELAFQRAAMVLPERFADQLALGALSAQLPDDCLPANLPCLFAAQPFINASDISDALLYDQDSQLFPGSELGAACFYITAEHGGIEDSVVEECTGYTVETIMPAVYHVKALLHRIYGDDALSMGATQCCVEETRFSNGLGEVTPEQRWSRQPFHCHMLANFVNADIAEF